MRTIEEIKADMKPIPNYEGYYATDDGKVLSYKSNKAVEIAPYISAKGYKTVKLYKRGIAHTHGVHRLVALAFHGERSGINYVARHLDGNKTNNTADNIAWGTRYENEADKRLHGTVARGSRQGSSKLKEADVLLIMRMSKCGIGQQKIGKVFSVSQREVGRIIHGERWAHLTRADAEAALKGAEHE